MLLILTLALAVTVPTTLGLRVTRFLFACLSYCGFAAYRLTRHSVHRAPCILACDSRQPESRIDLARSCPANDALRALNGGVDVRHSRSSSSVRFNCRVGNGTTAAVANNEDPIRLLCLCRVRRLKHREGVRDEEQQPKHECYDGWTDYFHTVTVPCAGI